MIISLQTFIIDLLIFIIYNQRSDIMNDQIIIQQSSSYSSVSISKRMYRFKTQVKISCDSQIIGRIALIDFFKQFIQIFLHVFRITSYLIFSDNIIAFFKLSRSFTFIVANLIISSFRQSLVNFLNQIDCDRFPINHLIQQQFVALFLILYFE